MKKIHFYKETKLIYSVWANDIQDVKLAPLDYYENYTNDLIISDIEYKHPILVNKTLREMTREELISQGIEIELGEGEVVVNKKLITTPKPSKWHKWINQNWIVNLEEAKKSKREELKAIRDLKVDENIEVYGAVFQVREKDTNKFKSIALGIALGKLKPNDIESWILADNTVREFTNLELVGVLEAKEMRGRKIFNKFIELDTQLQAFTEISQIEALEWD